MTCEKTSITAGVDISCRAAYENNDSYSIIGNDFYKNDEFYGKIVYNDGEVLKVVYTGSNRYMRGQLRFIQLPKISDNER